MKIIFHLDLDAFFVSVERILNPGLKGLPVIVGADPSGRGVVSAASYEARAFGVHSALPIGQAKRICPNGVFLKGHFDAYKEYSGRVRDLLSGYAPEIEQASIDEFYMDFTGTGRVYGAPKDLARALQESVQLCLCLPCSIGIGTNKTLAKISSDFAKPNGIFMVLPGREEEFLRPLSIDLMPGIGRVTSETLKMKGISKLGQIASLNPDLIVSWFGKSGLDLWKKSRGGGPDCLSHPREQKSISRELTFQTDRILLSDLETALFSLIQKSCQQLRDLGLKASTISIKLRYSDFVTEQKSKTLSPCWDDSSFFEEGKILLRKAYNRNMPIRLVGAHFSNLSEPSGERDFFEDSANKKEQLLTAIGNVRHKYGFYSIGLGKTNKNGRPG